MNASFISDTGEVKNLSENLALKPKHEVQDAHFSGKQHSLHCSIVEPGENKYAYHLSDDTNHDPVFVNEVLQDIFKRFQLTRNGKTKKAIKSKVVCPNIFSNMYQILRQFITANIYVNVKNA